MPAILIKNGVAITMDRERNVIENTSVLIRDDRIAALGDGDEISANVSLDEVIDARRMAILPGLIDSHGHAGHGLIKTLGVGHVGAWVDACLKVYATGSSADFWRAEARLVSLERLKAGVTTSISLMGGGSDLIRNDAPDYVEAYAAAVGEAGTRAYLAVGPNRPPYPHHFRRLEDGVEKSVDLDQQLEVVESILTESGPVHDGRVQYCLTAPVFDADRTKDGLDFAEIKAIFDRVLDQRQRHNLLFTQDGHRNGSIAFADELGALGRWSLMSHSVDLTAADIERARERDATIIHNPSAIMSIYGRCPVPELIDAGVRVVLGSDGAAPDRGYDMFRHMAQSMHYHRRHFRDPKVLPPGKVLEMVTIDAADGLGLANDFGSLEVGKKADIILVDLFKPHLLPLNMPVSRLAHFANAADVDTVVVDGRVLMRGRKVTMVDEIGVLEEAEAQATRMLKDNELWPLTKTPADYWRASRMQ